MDADERYCVDVPGWLYRMVRDVAAPLLHIPRLQAFSPPNPEHDVGHALLNDPEVVRALHAAAKRAHDTVRASYREEAEREIARLNDRIAEIREAVA